MPLAATCPSCGAALPESAVLALAPMCSSCGVVLTTIGGTLGMMGGYGVNDASLDRRRVEADLAVLREYLRNYEGMKQACLQQLEWPVDRYAKLPGLPAYLLLTEIPPWGQCTALGLGWAVGWFFLSGLATWLLVATLSLVSGSLRLIGLPGIPVPEITPMLIARVGLAGFVAFAVLYPPYLRLRAIRANGERPAENERRRRAYEQACRIATQVAGPVKSAEDHRLRSRIRELESLTATVVQKEAEVYRLLNRVG